MRALFYFLLLTPLLAEDIQVHTIGASAGTDIPANTFVDMGGIISGVQGGVKGQMPNYDTYYNKGYFIPALGMAGFLGSYREHSSEPNRSQILYDPIENRIWPWSFHPWWHDDEAAEGGHPVGQTNVDPTRSLSFGRCCVSGAQVSDMPILGNYIFDFLGGVGRSTMPIQNAQNNDRLGTGAYDPFNAVSVNMSSANVNTSVYTPATNSFAINFNTTPPILTDAAMATNNSDKCMYMFGGGLGASPTTNLWKYCSVGNTWTQLDGTQTCTPSCPPARSAASFVYDDNEGLFFLYSGSDSANAQNGNVINDFFTYDPVANHWQKLTPSCTSSFGSYCSGGFPILLSPGSPPFEVMTYMKELDAFFFWDQATASDQRIWMYRYVPGGRVATASRTHSYTVAPAAAEGATSGTLNRNTTGTTDTTQTQVLWGEIASDGSSLYQTWTETGQSGNGFYGNPYAQKWTSGGVQNLGSTFSSISGDATGALASAEVSIGLVNGVPVQCSAMQSVSLFERVYCFTWNGSAWVLLGGVPLPTPDSPGITNGAYAELSSIVANGTTPTFAEIERCDAACNTSPPETMAYVFQFSGGAYTQLGGAITFNALATPGSSARVPHVDSIALLSDGTNPWLAWTEYVTQLANAGDRLCFDNNGLTLSLGCPNAVHPKVYLSKWNGSSWTAQCGGAGNVNASNWDYSVSATWLNGKAYVAFLERTVAGTTQLFVRSCNGTTWATVGTGPLNRDSNQGWAYRPELTNDGANLIVTWAEQGNDQPWLSSLVGISSFSQHSRVYVSVWNGSTWTKLGGALNADTAHGSARHPSIAILNGQPVVQWSETKNGTLGQMYAKQWSGTDWAVVGSAPPPNACTAMVTSPTAASTQSGVVNWAVSITNCPSAYSATWQLDDFYNIGVVRGPLFTLANYNTGTPTDGPFNVRVILRDATGAIIATSADVHFTIQNFTLGNTVSVSSLVSGSGDVTATYYQNPTVSGTLSFDWRTSHSPSTNIVHTTFALDSQQLPTDTSLPPHVSFDTTQLTNGTHLIWSVGYCVQSDATCGGVIGSPIPRILVAFTVNVQNGTTLRGVQPNVENVSLTTGQNFTLSPVLARTDGTTTAGTFDYALNFACNLAERTQTQVPYLCVSGNTNPPTSAQGAAYISLSCTTTCASPVTITANVIGLTFVTITDHASGKSQVIEVDVRPTLAIKHFSKCGTIYSAYTPGGGCPSIFRTSIENATFGNDTFFKSEYVKAGYTAWETQFYQAPNNGTTNYSTFSAWQTAANTAYFTPITNQIAAMSGLCVVLRGENYTQFPQDSIEAEQGASASWTPADPLLYSLQQMVATGLICGTEQRDEADQGLGLNPAFSMKFSDASISKIACKTHVCMVYPGTLGLYPVSPIYNFGAATAGFTTFIRNATTTALNGLNTTACAFVSDWDAWLTGTAYCTDPSTAAPVPDSFTFTNASVADGTYNSGSDANLEILGYGAYTGYANSGSKQALNDNYQYFVGKFRGVGIPQTWPVLGATGFKSNLYYFGNTMSDYMTLFQSYAGGTDQSKGTGLPWGNSYWQYYSGDIFKKWGSFPGLGNLLVNSGSGKGWQTGGAGNQYSVHNQNVPVIGFVAMSDMTYNMGGINICSGGTCSMSGSTLTTPAPHNVPIPGNFLGTNYIKITGTGNSDTAMNTHWYAYPTGGSTLRLYNSSHGTVGCVSSGSFGSISIRGTSYTITNDGGSSGGTGYLQPVVSGGLPADVVPGELMTMTGAGAACAQNRQVAFLGFTTLSPLSTLTFNIADLANSTGTGGAFVTNSDQGTFNPLYDFQQSAHRLESLSQQAIYLAGQGNAGVRAYQTQSNGTGNLQWTGSWPNDNSVLGYQEGPLPYPNVQLELQQRWWAISPGLTLLKNRPSLFLTNKGPAPWIAPGPPYVIAESTTSATYGNTLVVWNLSEIPQAVSVPLGTFCQIGTNPISIYEMDWPHATTNLLTGAQTNYALTMNPGEMDVFACHPSAVSYVQPVSLGFAPPAGVAKVALQVVYGNYNQPLASYTKSVNATTSPLIVNLDPKWSSIWYQFQYMNASGTVIGRSDAHQLAQQ
jgi:hypothetical protein